MTDTHIRVLRLLANQAQRELVDHESIHRGEGAAVRQRREHLEQLATRTKDRLTDARTRRHHGQPD